MQSSSLVEQAMQTLAVVKEEVIAAPIDVVFETILEQMGPMNQTPDGTPLPMKLEPWPGGRWFRDFGNNTGHLWGFVQSFKPPTLLDIQGPLFMAAPVSSHVQYRLIEEAGGTRLKFSHRAIGEIPTELLDGVAVNIGWSNLLERTRKHAESKGRAK